jgi:CRP/FNR family cyclic AMP-dependent transcriptional regulator
MPAVCTDYDDAAGQARLIESLGRQELIAGNDALATEIAGISEVYTYDVDEVIIEQNGGGDDIFFILAGSARICAQNREIRVRRARCHIGEIAFIDPEGQRSADVIALERCTIARVDGADFRALADRPGITLWRNLSRSLADRMREHIEGVRVKNDRPRIFIGSTTEALSIAKAIKRGLDGPWANTLVWDQGVFDASEVVIESLEKTIKESDFAILVAGDDDLVTSRGTHHPAPRDNMVFEIGLAMGAIARKRTFVVTPRLSNIRVKWPSDLLGLNMEQFDESALPIAKRGFLGRLGFGARPSSGRYAGIDDATLDGIVENVTKRLRERMEKEGPY